MSSDTSNSKDLFIYHSARSKKVKLLARFYDYARKEYSYGFRMLTLFRSDGNTLLPISHTLPKTLSERGKEVILNCGKRWEIEASFEIGKSYLRLEKDCRILSYDAMTAHVFIVFTWYIFLAVEQ